LAGDAVARPRVGIPLTRIGQNRVDMREKGERGAVAARDPGDDVGTFGLSRDEVALDPVTSEVLAEHLRGARLVAGRVDGVDAEQLLQERCDLVAVRHSGETFESAVSSFRTSQSSGKETFVTSRPRSSTGVPCVPTTLSPITRATTW